MTDTVVTTLCVQYVVLSSYGLVDLASPQPDVKCFERKDIPESYVDNAVGVWVHLHFTVSLKVEYSHKMSIHSHRTAS